MSNPTKYFWIFVIVAINFMVGIDSELPTFQSLSSLKSFQATDDGSSECMNNVMWMDTMMKEVCKIACTFPLPCPPKCSQYTAYTEAMKADCMKTCPTCCKSNSDCEGTLYPYCDTSSNVCVRCLEGEYNGCENPYPICKNYDTCVGCKNDKECSEYYSYNYVCMYGSCYQCDYSAGDDRRCNNNYNGMKCLEGNTCGCVSNADCSNCYDDAGQCCCTRTKTCTWDVICNGWTTPPGIIQ